MDPIIKKLFKLYKDSVRASAVCNSIHQLSLENPTHFLDAEKEQFAKDAEFYNKLKKDFSNFIKPYVTK